MPNRLAAESSPYLRQHAENPVDWHPWGPDALDRARREDRPILLSIGYAACHWCHVMAHESFEDEETAELMNELFVNVKVDREERPDLDNIYMQAVQAMTGHGGWPMTVFLTPSGEPFYGGTYFPPEDRQGMPSFQRVLRAIASAYRAQRESVDRTVAAMRDMYERQIQPMAATGELTRNTLDRAARALVGRFDAVNGGFDGAPKFPQSMALDFLLRHASRTGGEASQRVVHQSFIRMARGGIYDQVGGGFHRYAVDAAWLVPHFEKMLYDNALLARLGVHLWQATGDLEARRVTEETIDWVAREMTSPAGGFYSALDADSEGHEGKFYLWDAEEVDRLLGADAELVSTYFGVTASGNFEGRNIFNVPEDPADVVTHAGVSAERLAEAVARAKHLLYAHRSGRVRPGRDDKILASWNGLMLRAICLAARAFQRPDYLEMAVRNGELLRSRFVHDGRVSRLGTAGPPRTAGFLEDHAAVALGFIALYEATFDRSWLDDARAICESMIRWFWDDSTGAFYDTAHDAETLITRPRDVTDNAVPSGTSLATELLLHLSDIYDDAELRRRADWLLRSMAEPLRDYPAAFGHLLGCADFAVHGAIEVAIAGDPESSEFRRLADEVARHYLPSLVLAGGHEDRSAAIGLLEGRTLVRGHPAAYVCRRYTCSHPVTERPALTEQLEQAPAARDT